MPDSSLPIPIAEPRLPPKSVDPADPRFQRLRRLGIAFTGEGTAIERIAAREGAYRRSLAFIDVVSAFLACFISLSVLGEDKLAWTSLALVPLIIFTSKVLGLYDRDELLIRKTTADELPAVLQMATTFTLVLWLSGETFVDGNLSRVQVLGLLIIMFLCMALGRWWVRAMLSRALTSERCLVVGARPEAQRLADKLDENPVNAEVVGRLALEDLRRDASIVSVAERQEVLGQTLERLRVDRVVVVPDEDEPELTLDLIRSVKSLGARVSVLPHVLEVVGSAVAYDDVYGMPVLGVRRFGLTRSSQILKRIMDLVVGGVLFLVFSPVMAVAAILIKLDSPGPVLFRQDRMGREGRRFRMLKFRSMVDGADALRSDLMDDNETDGLFKIAEDPRITRVGRVLRRTSLDELPQLFNVLRGDMSMVGPRPLVLDEDAMISGLDRRRLALTPGITGPWQILGSGQVPLSEMVQIDYLYAANWSAWGDVKILMRTVIYVLRGRGL